MTALVTFASIAKCQKHLLWRCIRVNQIDHIIAEKHNGLTELDNLALSCITCNVNKGSDIALIDPLTKQIVQLYHPRIDRWDDHFQIVSGQIIGLTPIGRTTIALLQMNTPTRIIERKFRHRLR